MPISATASSLSAAPPAELPPFDRGRLVRLCAYFSGDAQAAEDLAQETLVEAWRNAHKLYDLRGYEAWLRSIAHHVCRRWLRQQGRVWAHEAQGSERDGDKQSEAESEAVDLEIELERSELATLLDRALALLPAETRGALIERYVFDSSLAEAAERLGLSEGNIAVRLHRGKLTLQRLFQTTLKQEALDFGLLAPAPTLQPTRIWCPVCGQCRLLGQLEAGAGNFQLQCPVCNQERGIYLRRSQGLPQVFKGVKGFRAALTRSLKWSDRLITASVRDGQTRCVYCGRPVQPRVVPTRLGWQWDASCSACPSVNRHHLSNRLLASQVTLDFWRKHPRLRRLPEREAEAEGAATLIVGWESVAATARLEFLVARNTFDIVRLLHNG